MKKTFVKILSFCLCLLMLATPLCSCRSKDSSDKLTVLCTVFPVYDWVKSITQDTENIEVELLVQNGADLHSFQPSFSDMASIKNSDIVIYVGGESDKWVSDSISENAVAVELSSIDGMSKHGISKESVASESEDHHEHDHDNTMDEHIWLSVKNAMIACEYICHVLSEKSEINAEKISQSAKSYISTLEGIDKALTDMCVDASSPVVFADRFPFVYLFSDYNIPYYAAFEGCTTDTNADFSTIIELAEKLDESEYNCVLTTESPNDALVSKVISQATKKNAEALALNSMQSLTSQDIEDGASYIDIMTANTAVLQKLFKAKD
ncbi:MAG: zinc ABC transporter substrate-binding protein [Clostridia bacterium]|nr:zinc ABC transporter substrate-binding protein [Clostridia bacterium]